MTWLARVAELGAAGEPFVLVTVAVVRGHAPRGAGAKMVVTPDDVTGSIGGGNLEQSALLAARAMLSQGARAPELRRFLLNPHEGEHGVQCCGGEVSVLLEPVHPSRPVVAIFGAGHVGLALAEVLRVLPVAVTLIDSRPDRLAVPATRGVAPPDLSTRHAPVPESAVADLPSGAAVLVMTHDHAEDLAILDTVLRRGDLGFVGLIGSSTKWSRFRRQLADLGHDEAVIATVTSPIGLPAVPGKSPGAVAIATAAQLLAHLDLPEAAH